MIQLIQMTALLTAFAMAGLLAWTSIGAGKESKRPATRDITADPVQARARPAESPQSKDDKDRSGKIPIHGRVLTPDGKPVPGAIDLPRPDWIRPEVYPEGPN